MKQPRTPSSCEHLSFAAIQQALLDKRGSVTGAARALGVPSSDLRRLAQESPALVEAAYEAMEQGLDQAVAVLFEGMRRKDIRQQLKAAAFFLRHTEAGRLRSLSRRRAGAPG
jgi:hypothetical protein